ncbi:hypothetical protein BC832DRAFT_583595 [Gaertneriomyces semiglobifer]|nr:hypothetical protein BC832DRAFT_583595 [Gaertneriomyces semiglobifer]
MMVNLKRRGKAVVRVPSSSGAAVDLETTMEEDGSLRRIQVKSRKGEVEKMIEGNIKHSSMPSYTPQIAFPAHLVDSHIDATKLPNPLPPAPPKIDATDPLALGIHYHEAGNLVLSAYYLSISAALGHPVGCYLYAMALRHGWGCRQDTVAAVALFELAAEYVIQMLPTSQYRHTSLRFTRSFLPLPLYQLATCYHQGWGLPKSLSTALYYFQLAAQLGDTDAQEMCARMYIRGEGVKRDRKVAAKWLRECAKGGGRVIGESWIWKEKWGGNECDTASQGNATEATAIGKKASISAESKSSKGRWRGKSISGRTVNTRNSKASAQTMTTTNTFISQSSSATLIPSN